MEIDFTTIITMLDKFGWAGCILLCLLILLIKYAPALIKAQQQLTETATQHIKINSESQAKTAQAIETLSKTLESFNNHTNTTHIALKHIGRAIQTQADQTNTGPAVKPHTQAIEDLLGTQK